MMKCRLSIALPKETRFYLGKLAKLQKVSLSAKAAEFIEKGLEEFEDEAWAKIADKILKKSKGKTISHEKFWKGLL